MSPNVVTRFAPSPTGLLHAGNYRTALFSYLYAKRSGGRFILRIEDTDRERSKPEYESNILESLAWLGLEADARYRQSENAGSHRRHLERLVAAGTAYVSQETTGDRAEVIRFRNPKTTVTFNDLIRGSITFDTTELGDFVIARSFDEPVFHFAVVVDDWEEGVTHVIRGEDHVSNTPRQILIYEALGAPVPTYAHLPLILAPDRTKLSKRAGALPITEYRDRGYLPAALINFLALLGWNPGTDQELFSLAELVTVFDLGKVQKSGAVFNEEKLSWFNREYLKRLPAADQAALVARFLPERIVNHPRYTPLAPSLVPLIIDRVSTGAEIASLAEAGEFDYLIERPTYDRTLLKTTEFLGSVREMLQLVPPDDFTADRVKAALWDYATEKGRGNVLWPLRVALSGRERSPDPFTLAALLGREETLARLDLALR